MNKSCYFNEFMMGQGFDSSIISCCLFCYPKFFCTVIDLHVITRNGEHAWYGQRVIPSGGAIDQDAANDGSAPQIFATHSGMRGTYQVYINYYYNSGKKDHITGRLTVITDENTPREKQQSYTVQLLKQGELVLAKSFLY
ncbi:YfaP family protein [Formosimonas limnophila]|nr:DUF2135 domain-containing protein [Formosimonas limnophila]